MNKGELVSYVKDTANLSRADAEAAVNAVISGVENALVEGRDVRLVGFGSFVVKNTGPRKGRNPSNGAEIDVPASRKVVFKVGSQLKEAVVKEAVAA